MIYEFRCSRCGRRFDVYATLAEKEAGLSPACPSCGSTEVSRVFGRVFFLRPGGESGEGSPSDAGEASGEAGFGGDEDFDGGFGGGDPGSDGFGDDFGPDGDEGFAGDGEDGEAGGFDGGFGDELDDDGSGPGDFDDER